MTSDIKTPKDITQYHSQIGNIRTQNRRSKYTYCENYLEDWQNYSPQERIYKVDPQIGPHLRSRDMLLDIAASFQQRPGAII